LATITFDIAEGATGSTGLNIVQTSTTAGYSFDGQSHDVVISSGSDSGATETMTSQLSIDSETGAVTLSGDADYDVVPSYNITVTAENGPVSVSQDVGLLVATEYFANNFSYYSSPEDDVVHVNDPVNGSEIWLGEGEDILLLDQEFGHADRLTLKEFESGQDSIDVTMSLISLGYTSLLSGDDQFAQEGALRILEDDDIPYEILGSVFGSGPDSNDYDNVLFSYFDQDQQNQDQLNIVVDLSPEVGVTFLDRLTVKLGEDVTVVEDDVTVDFIA
jgi:hypothetical protein